MARAILHGIAVSTGIAIGKGFFLNRPPGLVTHYLVAAEAVENEVKRFNTAVAAVCAAFEEALLRLSGELRGHAEVINSHLLICKDPKLVDGTLQRIRMQRMNAEWALEESVARIADVFKGIKSSYIRDRIQDVRLVADRIGLRLAGKRPQQEGEENQGILLAHDISPADVMALGPERIFAFAVEQGGKTSHTGILARSLGVPALLGIPGLCDEVREGELVIVDALHGRLLVEPHEAELADYIDLQGQYEEYEKRIRVFAAHPAETEDGQRIAVLANIESSSEAASVLASGGEGIGLVRTEFAYLTRSDLPTEDELYKEYIGLAADMAPARVTFRSLDVGAEKSFSGSQRLEETNPALGMRGVRYCLRHQDIFRAQLRAVLRASACGNVALMFPLISDVSELRAAKTILNESRQELAAAGMSFDPDMPVGIMMELPSAVLTADVLAREADFFSIGTNDLIQYSLGVDRCNRHVAHMYQPLHPAIVRAIKQVIDMAHRVGISVSICGEMAADPYCLPILLGMSVDELSLAPQSIPAIKHLIRHSRAEDCRELLTHALSAPTARSINSMVRQAVCDRFPDDTSFFVSQMDADA